jgi:hypothetical protein
MLSVFMLSVITIRIYRIMLVLRVVLFGVMFCIRVEYHYAECHYAECYYGGSACYYTGCNNAAFMCCVF